MIVYFHFQLLPVLAHMTLNKHSWSIRLFQHYFIVNTYQRSIMLYKIVNNLVEVDLSKELIPITRHFRNCHAKSFTMPYEKKTFLQYSVLPRTIKQWNSLPATQATARSLKCF